MLEEAVKGVAEILLEVIFQATGHAVLWAFTLGRWKPSQGRDVLAMLVGVLFLFAVGFGLWLTWARLG